MSLLVPDYSSSSEDEAQPTVRPPQPSAPAPSTSQLPPLSASIVSLELPPPTTTATTATKRRRRVTKKPKTALFLHPDIQRLLESGSSRGLGDSDSDDEGDAAGGDSLLAKQKKAVAAKRPRVQPRGGDGAADMSSGLSFLPPPKHALEEKKSKQPSIVSAAADDDTNEDEATAMTVPQEYSEQQPAATYDDIATTAQYQQYYEQQGYYDSSQYQYQYEQQQQWQEQNQYSAFHQGEDETFGSSKRARNRDRDLERALQQGHFQSVASKIIEVQGPAPNAWAPPVDSLSGGDKDASDVKVQASFWNSQAGAKVATAKPNRMQRQKHQLNQLAFDAKLREHELMDKKGVSLKTKAETHAKYGW